MVPGLKKGIGIITAIVVLTSWPAVLRTPMALAQILDFEEVEALITKVDVSSRTLSLWDYRSGTRRTNLLVQGTVDLEDFKVGDYIIARIGVENYLVTEIRLLPPPKDPKFEKALHYVLGQEHK